MFDKHLYEQIEYILNYKWRAKIKHMISNFNHQG